MPKIPTQQENPKGLHLRYIVSKANGEPVDNNAEYFVLRLDENGDDPRHIEACRKAIQTYAKEIENNLPELSKDLMDRYGETTLHPFDELERYSHMYDFNVQMMDGDYNIYVERDGVDIYSIGGEKTLKDAVDRIIEWILRVNRIEIDNYRRC